MFFFLSGPVRPLKKTITFVWSLPLVLNISRDKSTFLCIMILPLSLNGTEKSDDLLCEMTERDQLTFR